MSTNLNIFHHFNFSSQAPKREYFPRTKALFTESNTIGRIVHVVLPIFVFLSFIKDTFDMVMGCHHTIQSVQTKTTSDNNSKTSRLKNITYAALGILGLSAAAYYFSSKFFPNLPIQALSDPIKVLSESSSKSLMSWKTILVLGSVLTAGFSLTRSSKYTKDLNFSPFRTRKPTSSPSTKSIPLDLSADGDQPLIRVPPPSSKSPISSHSDNVDSPLILSQQIALESSTDEDEYSIYADLIDRLSPERVDSIRKKLIQKVNALGILQRVPPFTRYSQGEYVVHNLEDRLMFDCLSLKDKKKDATKVLLQILSSVKNPDSLEGNPSTKIEYQILHNELLFALSCGFDRLLSLKSRADNLPDLEEFHSSKSRIQTFQDTSDPSYFPSTPFLLRSSYTQRFRDTLTVSVYHDIARDDARIGVDSFVEQLAENPDDSLGIFRTEVPPGEESSLRNVKSFFVPFKVFEELLNDTPQLSDDELYRNILSFLSDHLPEKINGQTISEICDKIFPLIKDVLFRGNVSIEQRRAFYTIFFAYLVERIFTMYEFNHVVVSDDGNSLLLPVFELIKIKRMVSNNPTLYRNLFVYVKTLDVEKQRLFSEIVELFENANVGSYFLKFPSTTTTNFSFEMPALTFSKAESAEEAAKALTKEKGGKVVTGAIEGPNIIDKLPVVDSGESKSGDDTFVDSEEIYTSFHEMIQQDHLHIRVASPSQDSFLPQEILVYDPSKAPITKEEIDDKIQAIIDSTYLPSVTDPIDRLAIQVLMSQQLEKMKVALELRFPIGSDGASSSATNADWEKKVREIIKVHRNSLVELLRINPDEISYDMTEEDSEILYKLKFIAQMQTILLQQIFGKHLYTDSTIQFFLSNLHVSPVWEKNMRPDESYVITQILKQKNSRRANKTVPGFNTTSWSSMTKEQAFQATLQKFKINDSFDFEPCDEEFFKNAQQAEILTGLGLPLFPQSISHRNSLHRRALRALAYLNPNLHQLFTQGVLQSYQMNEIGIKLRPSNTDITLNMENLRMIYRKCLSFFEKNDTPLFVPDHYTQFAVQAESCIGFQETRGHVSREIIAIPVAL